MHITLIGMSNIGKSHWTKRLAAESGFERVDCDYLIEQRLDDELTRQGYSGMEGMAKWLGQPFDGQYPETSRQYIEHEQTVMRGVIDMLRASPKEKPIVVDTTGSVIYTGDAILEPLRALTKIIFLEASRAHVAALFARYATDPKPLIWNESYVSRAGETSQDALKRCYPDLLEDRALRYAKTAHVTIPFEQHRKPDAALSLFAGYIK